MLLRAQRPQQSAIRFQGSARRAQRTFRMNSAATTTGIAGESRYDIVFRLSHPSLRTRVSDYSTCVPESPLQLPNAAAHVDRRCGRALWPWPWQCKADHRGIRKAASSVPHLRVSNAIRVQINNPSSKDGDGGHVRKASIRFAGHRSPLASHSVEAVAYPAGAYQPRIVCQFSTSATQCASTM